MHRVSDTPHARRTSYIIEEEMIFSFFRQKNRFDVNEKFQLYFDNEMAIFDVGEQDKVQSSVVSDKKQPPGHTNEPKFKVNNFITNAEI